MAEKHMGALSKLVEDLAFKAMSTEANDVAGLGDLLGDLEKISADESLSDHLKPVCLALVSLVETIIFNQDGDLAAYLDVMLEGVDLIQQYHKLDSLDENSKSVRDAHLEKLKGLGVSVQTAPEQSAVKPGEITERETEKTQETGEAAALADESLPEMEKNIIVDAETCYEFIAETLGNFDEAETTLVELEEDPTNKEFINALFRFFHTAKGVSGFLNLKRMNHFAHELENLLDELRNDRISLSGELTDFIFKSMDFLKSMLNEVKESLDRQIAEEPMYDVESHITDISSLLSGSREEEPEEESPAPLGEILVEMGKVTAEDVGGALGRQIASKSKERLGDILVKEGKVGAEDVEAALTKQSTGGQEKDSTVRVSTSKLDIVVNMVGELVIAESLVFQNPAVQAINDQKLFKDFGQLHRITSELQKTAMSMRMIPVRQTFQKMVRLVRDLARKSGKQVELHMSGEDTEIDRHMVDEIYDPLVHMIRNSVDHGLETPEERVRVGKSPKGNIHLRAYHQGGRLIIEIRDDGRGLSREKIQKKALERGLINPNDAYSDKEVYNFIFLPGFSTADKITDISGRGVGMDVVKRFIDKIRGSVEIDSVLGQGAVFVIKLPLTLAIIDGIMVTVGRERYIIPTMAVKESIQPQPNQIYTVTGKGEVVNIRGRILPLVRLHHILGINPNSYDPSQGIIVVLEYETEEFGLLIDELVGKQEVVIKSLGSKFKEAKGFSGGAILGDGRVGLILDVKGLLELFDEIGSEPYRAKAAGGNGSGADMSARDEDEEPENDTSAESSDLPGEDLEASMTAEM